MTTSWARYQIEGRNIITKWKQFDRSSDDGLPR